MISRRWVAVAMVGVALIAGPVAGQTFGVRDDASGNGFDLSEAGDPVVDVPSSMIKFGDGVLFNETNTFFSTAASLGFSGDGSWVIAAENGTEVSANSTNQVRWRLTVEEDRLRFAWGDGTRTAILQCDYTQEAQNISAWVTRNSNAILADEISYMVWDDQGNLICDETDTAFQDEGAAFDEMRLSGREVISGGQPFDPDRGIWELRVWDQLIDTSTLQDIADPSEPAFTRQAQGDELALYFLEPLDPAGEADLENTVAIYGEQDATVGESYTFHAEGHNSTGFTLDPDRNLTAFISTTTGATTSWLNASSGAVQAFVVDNEMVPVSGSENDTLFRLSIPDGFPQVGSWRIEVWMKKAVPGEPGANNRWVGTYDVKVEQEAAVATHQTDLVEFTKLTALEMAWFVGVAVAGVVLWSKSNDSVVRGFGCALPMFAGALLLAFGAEEGLGSVWGGTVPLAAVLFLVGGGMLVRMVYELITERDASSGRGFM